MKIIKRLKKIINYYNYKYNLGIFLEFTNYLEDTFFEIEANKIRILVPLPEQYFLNKESIYSLLHEIKHAIDYYRNPNKFLNELEGIKCDWMNRPSNYNSLSFERRANYFAKKEYKKWNKNIKKLKGKHINIK